MLFSRLWQHVASLGALQTPLNPTHASTVHDAAPFRFSDTWHVVGPFQIGTREIQWGADPLERTGGFHSLDYDSTAIWRSSLTTNATVTWTNHTAKLNHDSPSTASADLTVSFPDVDWQALRDAYGWAALQWQAWARGSITVTGDESILLALSTRSVLEYWIDDTHYFGGDFYGFDRAAVTLRLTPGVHRVDVRLVRDVRSMGGVGRPDVNVKLALVRSAGRITPVLQNKHEVLIADLIDTSHDVVDDAGDLVQGGRGVVFASSPGSIILRNDGGRDFYVHGIDTSWKDHTVVLHSPKPVKLIPGQTRPIAFNISHTPQQSVAALEDTITLSLIGRFVHEEDDEIVTVSAKPAIRKLYEPHKITYHHFSGIVSYAILRAPSADVSRILPNPTSRGQLATFVGLHGAGLEAEDDLVKHALDPLPDLRAFVVFPTGVTPWSGDDWHAWGFADVEAATFAIETWCSHVDWPGELPNIRRWIVAGHSNGGQGTWYALTHRPDYVIAAAPLSGYSSIQNYVPYHMWSLADPGRTAIVQASLLEYHHESLVSNSKGIPILQQHGSLDDNVPAYNSRLMNELIAAAGGNSTYYEVAGENHWWDGVMTTEPLKSFYREHTGSKVQPVNRVLPGFTLTTANPGDTGWKLGLQILQLNVPGQLGRLEVTFDLDTSHCFIKIINVAVFFMKDEFWKCAFLRIDNQVIDDFHVSQNKIFVRTSADPHWQYHDSHSITYYDYIDDPSPAIALPRSSEPRPPLRRGAQFGSMNAILRTGAAFQIHPTDPSLTPLALQISRNLHQYFGADTHITPAAADDDDADNYQANHITLVTGFPVSPPGSHPSFPLRFSWPWMIIRRADGHTRAFYVTPGLGAIWLQPRGEWATEVVVWGADVAGLRRAARLLPLLTGAGQPDWVVLGEEVGWKGLEGVKAMGFWDQNWNVSSNSFFENG